MFVYLSVPVSVGLDVLFSLFSSFLQLFEVTDEKVIRIVMNLLFFYAVHFSIALVEKNEKLEIKDDSAVNCYS